MTKHAASPLCSCLTRPAAPLTELRSLGVDRHFAESSLMACPACGRHWLHYFYNNEAFAHSGRWFRGYISLDQLPGLSAETAKAVLESLDWYYYGGSYFDGNSGRSSGPILLSSQAAAITGRTGPDLKKLLTLFEEIRSLVDSPQNDFTWSSWNDEKDALEEIDHILQRLRAGEFSPLGVSILFAPTSPLQELSLNSGWGDEFVALADRYDEALAGQDPSPEPSPRQGEGTDPPRGSLPEQTKNSLSS